MSGVSLPYIPGASPAQGANGRRDSGGGSRPGSGASGNYQYVPQVYYSSPQGINISTPSPRPGPVAINNFMSPRPGASVNRSPQQLPSLRHQPAHNGSHTSRTSSRKGGTNSVRARYSARHRRSPGPFSRASADSPYLPKASEEECLKCLLRVPHKKCVAHKYIRVGGGYRHGYWYIKCLMEELELQRQRELAKQQRLEAIKEHMNQLIGGGVKAIKTWIRTKSGRLVERIIFLSEEDYEAFKAGQNIEDLLKKYLTAEEAAGLESWDKDEVVAVKTWVRTKSGRLIEKLVYVSKEDYDAIKAGTKDAKDILAKYAADGEVIEGWEEAKMRTIKTYVRTKSGRLIEKTIMISEEDYQAMIRDGVDPNDIIRKYLPLGEGETVEGWQSGEPMKAIKTMVRTKSGRLIEKTIYVTADDYERMMEEIKQGRDPNAILQKYLGEGEGEVEGWEKLPDGTAMKVVKTYIRTKSGRLIEKTIMLTEEEYAAFVASGGNPDFLKQFIKLEKGEVIEDWEKASTVYSAGDDEEVQNAKPGQRIVGADGTIYEVYVDPLTGKKYKKKVGHTKDGDTVSGYDKHGKKIKKGGKGGAVIEETPEERAKRKAGGRDKDSDSDYSYRSVYSAGGTRHVKRKRRRADGTYSAEHSYNEDEDEDGAARRRRRRRTRAHGGSAHSYYSVTSEGGTRHVRRKKRHADGTYSNSESYHSSDSEKEGGTLAKRKKAAADKAAALAKKKKGREHGSGSDHSYYSDVSAGGTRTRKRKKKIRDKDGNVIGYESAESYSSASSNASTDSEDERELLKNMTKEEKEKYFKDKAKRKAEREKKRKEKYGDNYEEEMAKKEKKKREKKGYFSDASTDEETEKELLKNMTEAEKKKYFEDKEKRVAAREAKRKEKYGDKYEEMKAKNEKRKQAKKDGNEADSEGEYETDPITGERRKKLKGPRKEIKDGYEYEYDEQGRVIRRKRIGKDGDSGSEVEYEYDKDGNLIGEKRKPKPGKYEKPKEKVVVPKKKKEEPPPVVKKNQDDTDDGNYFEVDEKGQIRLKAGKKKIDLSKLTDDDLRKLGIDPSLSKQEIARLLKEKFGDDLIIIDGKGRVGTRRLSQFGSDANTDDLAGDSDLDVSTLKGTRRVNVLMKRGGKKILEHMKKVMDQSKLQDNARDNNFAKDLDERDGDVDFLSHYRLVDSRKLENYARAFVVEDDDYDTVIDAEPTRAAIEGVASVQHMTERQMDYVFKVLKIDDATQVTFRMFAVISALCERVTQMDNLSKHLLEVCDLLDIERKMALYQAMFYTNVSSDRDSNYIQAESLRIELIAGGLNWKQQEFIMDKLQPNKYLEISFLDYICYIPLFLSMHDNIVDNPLDMNNNKYDKLLRKPSGLPKQRDANPLGQPLKRDSAFLNRHMARELLEGKVALREIREDKRDLISKYSKLPNLMTYDDPKHHTKIGEKHPKSQDSDSDS